MRQRGDDRRMARRRAAPTMLGAALLLAVAATGCSGGSTGSGVRVSGSAGAGDTPTPRTSSGSTPPSVETPAGTSSARVTGMVATGITTPWGLAFLPGGQALVGERDTGRVRVVGGGTNRVVGTVPGVVHV